MGHTTAHAACRALVIDAIIIVARCKVEGERLLSASLGLNIDTYVTEYVIFLMYFQVRRCRVAASKQATRTQEPTQDRTISGRGGGEQRTVAGIELVRR